MSERRPSGVIVVEKAMIASPAFRDLSGTGVKVLFDFLGKRKFEKRKKGLSWPRPQPPKFLNNGELVYTYDEAAKRGITRPAFVRALDDLIEHGFLDIAQTGAGLFKSATLYALADRWTAWGTDAFISQPRPKRTGQMGFRKGHPPYQKAQGRKGDRIFPSNGNVMGSSNGSITGASLASNASDTGSQR